MKRANLILLTACLALPVCAAENPFTPPNFPIPQFPGKTLNVKTFGATGGGAVNDTPAIDRAVAACNAAGGGTVFFPAGRYAAASIHLMSNVRLLLDRDAVIFGGPRADFDKPERNPFDKYQDFGHGHFHDSLMWGAGITNFAVEGGTINGGTIGHGDPKRGGGDKLITVVMGKGLLFKNVTHDKGGHFAYLLNDCRDVTLDHVVIRESRDAVDLMSCSDVQIHDCRFTGCADDTIGVKSDFALGRKIESANIYVWDSYFESGCNGLQFGSETAGDFHNVNFWNIGIGRAMKAGIGVTTGDGAIIDDVNYSNIDIRGAACPIYMLVWSRLRTGVPHAQPGAIENVRIEDVTVSHCMAGRQGPVMTAAISGLPGHPLRNITLENVKIAYPGGDMNSSDAEIEPPYMHGGGSYSPRNLGPRPAAGLYVRNADGLTLKNVQFTFAQPDARPALVANHVNGLTLDGFAAPKSTGGQIVRLASVRDLTVENSPGLKDAGTGMATGGR